MVRATVNVIFEAKDKAEVEAKLAGWKLHEGCQVSVMVMDSVPPQQTDDAGALVPVPEPEPAPEVNTDVLPEDAA